MNDPWVILLRTSHKGYASSKINRAEQIDEIMTNSSASLKTIESGATKFIKTYAPWYRSIEFDVFCINLLNGPAGIAVAGLLYIPVAWVLCVARRSLGFGVTCRLLRAMRLCECPVCGYRLISIRKGIVECKVTSVRKCAECGLPWPLVPWYSGFW